MKVLTTKQEEALRRLVTCSAFDKKDNTLCKTTEPSPFGTRPVTVYKKLTTRHLAELLGLNTRKLERDLAPLIAVGAVKRGVLDIWGIPRLMVNPDFYWTHADAEKPLAKAMYLLGSHKLGAAHTAAVRSLGYHFDPLTGAKGEPVTPEEFYLFHGYMQWADAHDYGRDQRNRFGVGSSLQDREFDRCFTTEEVYG